MDPALVLALAARCAPGVSPHTLLAVARAESALDPLAIGVRGGHSRPRRPANRAEAADLARRLAARGLAPDLGLAQINVRNLARLGLTFESAFDPCQNLAASGQVLRAGYRHAATTYGAGQPALRVALSYYNTGDAARGFRNGYVARVVAHAAGAPRGDGAPSGAAATAVTAPGAIRLSAQRPFVISPLGAAP